MMKILTFLAYMLVRTYQMCVSPFLLPSCRFQPTCSEYACEAFCHHGAFKGAFLAVKRILSCHPFGKTGYDPVPPSPSTNTLLNDRV